MIHANRIVTVGEQECIIDRPIVLYRGDREVEIEFTLVGNEFMFSEEGNVIKSVNASHGQLVLNTPSGENMFSELAECHEGKVVFVVTKEMIDEFIEVGFYSFQIRLYDSAEMKSRVTIPPVMNGFDIRNPIAAEDETNVVDQGLVGYARVFKDQSNEELPTFDWTGAYNKTEWAHHDVITENKLNKIEDALYSINANVRESDVVILNTLDQVKNDADKYVKEHIAEFEQDVEDFERSINTGVEKFKVDVNSAMTAHKNDADKYVKEHIAEFEQDVEEFERNLNTGVEKFKVDVNSAMTAHKNEVSEELEGFSTQLTHNVNTLKLFEAKFDGNNDDSIALNKAIQELEEYSTIYIPSNVTLTLKSTVNVDRHINLKCLGNINAPISDMVLFNFGTQDKSIRYLNWEINNIVGLGSTDNQICFLFNNASFNKFNFNTIERFKYILHFKGLDNNASLGQNLFYYTSFSNYDKAIYFEGADDWANAPWAEGNQFMGGFIVRGNVGLELTPNIKCNAILLQGAVDNMEVENSYDIVNNSTPPPTYNTGNLFLSNFYRNQNCVFGVNDTRMEPNTGIYVNGSIVANGYIKTTNGSTSVELNNGAIELCAPTPFIDMKNDLSEDRDVRLLANNNEFIVSAGDRTKVASGLRIKDNKITKIFPVGMNYGIPIGSTNVTIKLNPEQDNINYAVNVTPSWLTTYRVYDKTTSSFSIEFGSPATGDSAWIDYMLIGNVNY